MSIASEQETACRNTLDRTETGQTRPEIHRHLAVSNLKYWQGKLKKRSYRDRDGDLVEVPELQVRLFHAGLEAWFNLGTSNESAAAVKARSIHDMLIREGWQATLAKYKPKAESKIGLTVDGFADVYRSLIPSLEYPPSKPSYERYLKSLDFICRRVRVKKVEDLTVPKIEAFKADYLAEGRKDGRAETSVKTTINFHVRNAGALFSKNMLAAYQEKGLVLMNPFAGQKIRRVEIKGYSPLKRELLEEIWRDAAKLRDGDPDAPPLEKLKGARWQPPDLREPHPDAYVLLLLELGLGLRRNEADKAEWDWLFDQGDRHYLEVKATSYFTPKSKERRVIPVEKVLYDALQATRIHAGAWIVPGRLPKRYEEDQQPKNIVYRCDRGHRALAAWLRLKGIADDKPCHLLRKEFGSYVATAFSLFHAQKMLGHSSPNVTAAYYAGLTDLPQLKHAKLGA